MKIAILTPTFIEYSGIDRVAEQQAIEYSKKGNQVTIFTLKSKIKPKGYKIIECGMPHNPTLQRLYRLFFFLDKKKIKKYVEILKGYDLIISHFYPMNILASYAKKKYNIKYIFYNHGIGSPDLFKNIQERLYMKLFIKFNNSSLKNVDQAYSISKFMQSELRRESGIDSKVDYNKINKNRFNPHINPKKIIDKLNLKNYKVLLYVGRLSPHKGIDLLIKSFNQINTSLPNTKLIIIGKPTFSQYYKTIKKIANKNVIFLEDVDDMELPYYYSACDVYVTASLWEGFNLPAAEAQECGKPVVAFDMGPHKEIIKNGKLVKEKDTIAFAEAVISLLKK